MKPVEVKEQRVKIPWWVHDALTDETPNRVHACVGGLGGGKSHGGQIWDVHRCLQNGAPLSDAKPTKSWTVAPNYLICNTLMELTLQVAQDVFGLRSGSHFKLTLTSPKRIDFSPMGIKHELSFRSADNPLHFVSDSLTHWRWSEPGVSKPEVFGKLMDRLRDPRGKVVQGLMDGTPESTDNHYYQLAGFINDKRDAVDHLRNFRAFRIETGDNVKNLAPGYLETLRARYAYNPALLDSYERGLFTNFRQSDSAYWNHTSRNVIDPLDPEPYSPLLFCWDFNVTPLAWAVMQQRWVQENPWSSRFERYVALGESSGTARGTMEGVAEFAARFPVSRFADTPIHVYGDRNGWSTSHKISGSDYEVIEHALQSLGYRNVLILAYNGANPLIKQRLETAARLMAYGMFVVTSDCRNLISGLSKTRLKKGTYDIEKGGDDKHSHWPDAVTYCLYQLFKDRNIFDPNWQPVLGIG